MTEPRLKSYHLENTKYATTLIKSLGYTKINKFSLE